MYTSAPTHRQIRLLILLIFAFTLFFTGCRKEIEMPATSSVPQNNIPSFEKINLLKRNFNQSKNTGNSFGNNTAQQFYSSLMPLWNSSRYLPGTGDSVVYIPLFDSTLLQQQYIDVYLTIKSNAAGDIYGLLVCNLDSAYYANSAIEPTLENFTGTIYQVNEEGKIRNFTNFTNGRYLSYLEKIGMSAQQSTSISIRDDIDIGCLDELFNPVKCYSFGPSIWKKIGNYLSELWKEFVNSAGEQPTGPGSNLNGWFGGAWSFGGSPIYFDPTYTGNGYGTYSDPNNPNATPIPTYTQLKDVLDPPVFRNANKLAAATCLLYTFNIRYPDFWNIMANFAFGYIDANPNFIDNNLTPIQSIDLFEKKYEELLFLKEIGHPLSNQSIETPAYVWLKNNHDLFVKLAEHRKLNSQKDWINLFQNGALELAMTNECDILSPNFEECVADKMAKQEFEYFANVLYTMGFNTYEKKMELIYSSNKQVYTNITCDNCPQDKRNIIYLRHKKSIEKLRCLIDKMKVYNGDTPYEVFIGLQEHFGNNTSKLLADYLRFIAKITIFFSTNENFTLNYNCSGTTLVRSYPLNPLSMIELCDPNFFNTTEQEQWVTIIHEAMHKYFGDFDLAYEWETGPYYNLNTLQQLINADAFAEFARVVCP